jgi:hypothetical protein
MPTIGTKPEAGNNFVVIHIFLTCCNKQPIDVFGLRLFLQV